MLSPRAPSEAPATPSQVPRRRIAPTQFDGEPVRDRPDRVCGAPVLPKPLLLKSSRTRSGSRLSDDIARSFAVDQQPTAAADLAVPGARRELPGVRLSGARP